MIALVAGACAGDEVPSANRASTTTGPLSEGDDKQEHDAGEDGERSDPSPDADTSVAAVSWSACEADFECGFVAVPIDYDRPAEGVLSIAVIRRPATAEAIGSIFVNPGGPGVSGFDFVRNGFALDEQTSASFHLVGFDPRGIGRSAPLGCSVDRATGALADLSPDSGDEEDQLNQESKAIAQGCQSTDGALLPHLSTNNVARDLDRLRQAVGDKRLHFFGWSYGTLLGFTYGQLFPANVGHLVLDGVVDPDLGLAGLLRQQALAFEQEFALLEQRCASEGPCPEGGLLSGFDRLYSQLEQSGPIDGVGSTELVIASLLPVYSPNTWTQYRAALVDAEQGRLTSLGRLSDFFTGSTSFTAYAAFSCSDSRHPDGAVEWSTFAQELDALAPRFGAVVANELRVCAFWPPPSPQDSEPSEAGAAEQTSALIVGTTGDAATPLDNALSLSKRLANSHLVTLNGDGHTAYNGSRCVRSLVAQYFADQLAMPGRSTCDDG